MVIKWHVPSMGLEMLRSRQRDILVREEGAEWATSQMLANVIRELLG